MFGKNGDDIFNMDISYPLTPFIGLGLIIPYFFLELYDSNRAKVKFLYVTEILKAGRFFLTLPCENEPKVDINVGYGKTTYL